MSLNLGIVKHFGLVFMAFGFAGNILSAYEIRLDPPKEIQRKGEGIYIDLSARKELLNEDFENYLRYGIVIHFTYQIKMYQVKFFFDDLTGSRDVQKTLRYDIWKKSYILTDYHPGKRESHFKDLDDVRLHLLELKNIKIANSRDIEKKGEYYFKTRVTAKISQFKSYFHVVFSLLSIFTYKTTYLKSEPYSGELLLET